MDVGGLCDHCCYSLTILASDIFVAAFCLFSAMLAPNAVHGQGVRRRLVAKQPAPQQLVESGAKRRRLSEKQPVPALLASPSSPAVPVLPVDLDAWGD